MSSNSFRSAPWKTASGDPAGLRDFLGPYRQGDLLQHAVHEAVAFGAAIALAELDRLVQHHLERRLRVRGKLEAADVEDRALHGRELLEGAVEVRRDERLELRSAVAHA